MDNFILQLTGAKRERPQEEDPDYEDLTEENEPNSQVEDLKRELAELRRKNKTLAKMLKDSNGQKAAPAGQQVDDAAIARLRRSLGNNIKAQMVYKPNMKREPPLCC